MSYLVIVTALIILFVLILYAMLQINNFEKSLTDLLNFINKRSQIKKSD